MPRPGMHIATAFGSSVERSEPNEASRVIEQGEAKWTTGRVTRRTLVSSLTRADDDGYLLGPV